MDNYYTEIRNTIQNDGFYRLKINKCFEGEIFYIYKARIPQDISEKIGKIIKKFDRLIPIELVCVGYPIEIEGKIDEEKNKKIFEIKCNHILPKGVNRLDEIFEYVEAEIKELKENNLYEYYQEVYKIFRPEVLHYEPTRS